MKACVLHLNKFSKFGFFAVFESRGGSYRERESELYGKKQLMCVPQKFLDGFSNKDEPKNVLNSDNTVCSLKKQSLM